MVPLVMDLIMAEVCEHLVYCALQAYVRPGVVAALCVLLSFYLFRVRLEGTVEDAYLLLNAQAGPTADPFSTSETWVATAASNRRSW